MPIITCHETKLCKHHGQSTICLSCKHNRTRNKEIDMYVKAEDNPFPDKCPKLTFDGPEEHTSGWKCPVCGEFTSPYSIKDDSCCIWCGYKLNI